MRLVDLIAHRHEIFNTTDIGLTAEFLTFYYRKLAGVGHIGIDIIKRGEFDLFDEWEHNVDRGITHLVEQLGGHDVTPRAFLKRSRSYLDSTRKKAHVEIDKDAQQAKPFDVNENASSGTSSDKVSGSSAGVAEPYQAFGDDADAKSLFLADRYLNNANTFEVSQKKPEHRNAWRRFVFAFKKYTLELFDELKQVLRPEEYDTFHPHVVEFTEDANLLERSLGHFLNFLRTILIRGMGHAKHVVAIFVNSAKQWWDLCFGVLDLHLDVSWMPMRHWWFGASKPYITILDMINVYGGIFATMQHKFYNNYQAPFSADDLTALQSAPSHELLLYTWNHHPLTASRGNEAIEKQRLGIYDWVPRQASQAVAATQVTAFNLPLLLGGGDTQTPGAATMLPQFFNNLINVLFRIGSYPLTQLTTNDPAVVAKSQAAPNRLFLGA
ncbi:hypothetical protein CAUPRSCDRAFT_12390, partial [Caulochytrium protostelioides]